METSLGKRCVFEHCYFCHCAIIEWRCIKRWITDMMGIIMPLIMFSTKICFSSPCGQRRDPKDIFGSIEVRGPIWIISENFHVSSQQLFTVTSIAKLHADTIVSHSVCYCVCLCESMYSCLSVCVLLSVCGYVCGIC